MDPKKKKVFKIFISSGEPSSDVHASHYLKKLKAKCDSEDVELDAFGVGGETLGSLSYFRNLVTQDQLTAMGFMEVIGKLPSLFKILTQLEIAILKESPQVAVLFDYPEFHFKLAARLKKINIPRLCFIPPKVWVWRSSRLLKIKTLYNHVFTIFPFETALFENEKISVDYIGNPLLDELPFQETQNECRDFFGLKEEDLVLLVMPGSRDAEIKYHLELFLKTANTFYQKFKNDGKSLKILMPLPHDRGMQLVKEKINQLGFSHLPIQLFKGNSGKAMKAATAGLIKSGTSTLEAALLDCPHIVAYNGHMISKLLFKFLVKYKRAISLPNLIFSFKGEKKDFVVPEFILEDFNEENFKKSLGPLLDLKSSNRLQMLDHFKEIQKKLQPNQTSSPLTYAAERSFELFYLNHKN